ncbi:MAG: shikimate kinase [Bacteroidota bacterium]
MKVVLVGYMASGKSSIGRLLAKELSVEFIDLDEYIEEQMDKSIATIFSQKGEIYFRKKEHEMLTKVLNNNKSMVLSTGGGTPCYANNMETILKNSDHSIYLQLSVSSLVDRIQNEKEKRPLVKNVADSELSEFIGKHLFERRQFYSQASCTIDCNNKSIATLTSEIKELLL